MKIKLNGNVATVSATIPFETLKKVGQVNIADAETKDAVYAASAGTPANACISKYGVIFGFGDDTTASLNICYNHPVTKEEVADELGEALAALNAFETHVAEGVARSVAAREEILAAIEE